jgi:uncharacterized protein YjeT (DUF2065 family)
MNIEIATTSIMFAKAYGIYFIGVGLGLMSNPHQFRKWYEDILSETRRQLMGATLALLIGSFILANHHVLVLQWPLLITAIGYWGVITGIGCLASSEFIHLFRPMINASENVYRLSGLGWFIIGAFLLYVSMI